MGRDNPGRRFPVGRRLARLDLVAHGVAFASCAAGGIIVESVILVAAASHHAATIAFRLLSIEKLAMQTRPKTEVAFSVVQIALCMCCVVMVLVVIALGTHDIFHGESLDALAVAAFALPGSFAIATTAGLACGSARAGEDPSRADAVLSAVPTALAFGVAFCDLGIAAGRLDALAGLVAVLVLCVRAVINLGQTLDLMAGNKQVDNIEWR